MIPRESDAAGTGDGLSSDNAGVGRRYYSGRCWKAHAGGWRHASARLHVLANSGQKKYLLNLAGVEFIDSYGIGELARCYATVRRVGGEMRLAQLSKKVHGTLQITNLDTLFEIHSEEKAAVQAFLRRA